MQTVHPHILVCMFVRIDTKSLDNRIRACVSVCVGTNACAQPHLRVCMFVFLNVCNYRRSGEHTYACGYRHSPLFLRPCSDVDFICPSRLQRRPRRLNLFRSRLLLRQARLVAAADPLVNILSLYPASLMDSAESWDSSQQRFMEPSGNGRVVTRQAGAVSVRSVTGHVLSLMLEGRQEPRFRVVQRQFQKTFTICSILGYSGAVKLRILQCKDKNWLHGHHDNCGNAGGTYHGNYIDNNPLVPHTSDCGESLSTDSRQPHVCMCVRVCLLVYKCMRTRLCMYVCVFECL
jgi:hypothetical protein